MEINLYPEMNKEIVDILRLGGDDEENQFQMYAAALIEAYRASSLEPDEIPHWIPVSERLPVENEYREKDTGELIPILVCVKGTKYPFRAMYDGKTWGDGISKIEVTYWQPLPQPPKGEKSK